ncbi:MAG: hypothetical protein HC800_19415, partial [Phormidesmis sp. RL_2_1]|nr:hypothetical protein [Phormidesmis sp. RL_2_1]
MAYSPTRVFPEPVGAQTITDSPWFKAAIALAESHLAEKEKGFQALTQNHRVWVNLSIV